MRFPTLAALTVTLLLALVAPALADGNLYAVTGTEDGAASAECTGSAPEFSCPSLRSAVAKTSGADEILLAEGTYTLSSQLEIPAADSDLVILGAGARATRLQAVGADRVLAIDADASLVVFGATIAGGSATDSGGNILNQGSLFLEQFEVTGGTAPDGAGIDNRGELELVFGLVDHNTGGGVLNRAGASLEAIASTIAFNSAYGVSAAGNADLTTSVFLWQVTVGRNAGDGVRLGSQVEADMLGSIVAANGGASCTAPVANDDGGNLEDHDTCGLTDDTSRANADPLLSAALTNAGGDSDVLTIPADSPAVDRVSECFVVDQRGFDRGDPPCDAGAYEQAARAPILITGGPSGETTITSPSFTFASDPGDTFECSLTGPGQTGEFTPCTSPKTYSGLAPGDYEFAVRTLDSDGQPTGQGDTRDFTVVAAGPDTALAPIVSPTGDATPTFTFSSPDSEATFECRVDGGAFTACDSPYTTAALTDGSHTFDVRAIDADDNPDPTPASQTFVVDATAPDTTLTPIASPTRDSTPTFAFGSSEQPSTFECKVDDGAFAACSSPSTTPALAEGSHTFSVRATDAAANTDATPASQTFRVDLTPPPAPTVESGPSGVTSDPSPSFTFAPSDGTAAIECSLTGPGQSGVFQPCSSPASFSALGPGNYTFTVRARDAAGNTTASSRSFTVAAPQQATPTPTPTASPTPTPVPQQSVVVAPVKGKILVKKPGSNTFVEVDGTQGIPLGSTIDATHGTIQLTSQQTKNGQPQTAQFYAGQFKITQTKTTTDLTLNQPLAPCAKRGKASAAAKKKPKTRSLWGSGHGSFRTRGQYSSATVRGTKWLVEDSCAGTLTRVAQGVVAVRDDVRHRTITLRAGKKYLARPRR